MRIVHLRRHDNDGVRRADSRRGRAVLARDRLAGHHCARARRPVDGQEGHTRVDVVGLGGAVVLQALEPDLVAVVEVDGLGRDRVPHGARRPVLVDRPGHRGAVDRDGTTCGRLAGDAAEADPCAEDVAARHPDDVLVVDGVEAAMGVVQHRVQGDVLEGAADGVVQGPGAVSHADDVAGGGLVAHPHGVAPALDRDDGIKAVGDVGVVERN